MPDQSENRIDDDLLGKYLAGETDAAESERVRRWLDQDQSERQEFDRFERIWNTAGQLKQRPEPPSIPVDTDAAWQKMRSKMSPPAVAGPKPLELAPESAAPEPVVKPLPVEPFRTTRNRSWWQSPAWAVAAMAVLVSGLLWVLLQQTKTEPIADVAAVTTTDKIEKILPDGSTVLLNKDSKLIYPERFAADSREVQLTGEAFFDVKPDPSKPFRIRVRNTTVQVLGTSFSIRAYTDDVRVAVRTGKVKFSARKQEITLVRNEQAAFDAKKDTIIKAPKFDVNAMTFQTGKLVFDNEPLSNVIKALNEVYHADIHLANAEIGQCKVNASFENDSLEDVLKTTAEAMHLSILHDGNRIILNGKPSCK
ncbi:FecR family protein [Larkinella arboricola]|uniref:FecR family protein n=1 Tax=Larkinella arboricola TaxID=643671 RepID=A0A327WNC0_LARAB|nr:FecR domain-containing protein [Larkinella arboricola]RAJ92474.1 FecR family protein [Larkinella arboricola]